jgi:hypothetical protein
MYLTLPSNTNPDTFPNNKIHDYTIKLPKRIDFGDYEAALVEIQYPLSWPTSVGGDIFVISVQSGRNMTIRLPRFRYASLTHLATVLNEKLSGCDVGHDPPRLTYDPISRRTRILIENEYVGLAISDSLANVLGFPGQSVFETGDHFSPQFADIDEGMTALYVYSNIVQNQIVGDATVPLLRAVPIKTDSGGVYKSQEFRHPHYLPLVKESTDLIQIKIARDNGKPVKCMNGKVIVTQHLRRIVPE